MKSENKQKESFSKINLFFESFFVKIHSSFFVIPEIIKLLVYYFKNHLFFVLDIKLRLKYLLKPAYKHTSDFFKLNYKEFKKEPYGETPISVFDKIVTRFGILSSHIVYDLGTGTGRLCFWLSCFVKSRKVVGLDIIPSFIEIAEKLRKHSGLINLSFKNEEIMQADFSEADFIYFYGTCFDDNKIVQLIEKFKTLKPTTKIISVSYALSEFCLDNTFVIEDQMILRFPWGKTVVYLNSFNN